MEATGTLLRDRLEDLWGCSVLDRDGERVGSFEEVFYDAADTEPEWLAIGVGLLGRKLVLVPAAGVNVNDFSIRLPFDGKFVGGAPELRRDDLDAEIVESAHRYYRSTF